MRTDELDALNKQYKIYAEVLEYSALRQFTDAMKQDCVVKGALMPDAHTGYTLPIGAVVATDGMIFPSFVGYDIGCGVLAIPTTFVYSEIVDKAQAIFDGIVSKIPTGFSHNKRDQQWLYKDDIPATDHMRSIFAEGGLKQLGTLGSGNHFIEIGVDQDNEQVWLIIHSGSRGIGHTCATRYMKAASGTGKAAEGFYGLSVDSRDGLDYITDMNFCLQFALQNRMSMVHGIEEVLRKHLTGKLLWGDLINRNHNHAEKSDGLWVHRKGATHAELGMLGVIPGNMLAGTYIVVGNGCEDSLCSSSHGAGRVMSRAAAKANLSLDDFTAQMAKAGIVANVSAGTLDEAPGAYKDITNVMSLQKETVATIAHLFPIINVKGNAARRRR